MRLLGKHVTCFCLSLGAGTKGSVLEFSKEAIFGIRTGNVLVRMLLLSTGEKQNKTHRKLLHEGVPGSLSRKKMPGDSPFQEDRKDNLCMLEANMLECRWRSPFSGTFQG